MNTPPLRVSKNDTYMKNTARVLLYVWQTRSRQSFLLVLAIPVVKVEVGSLSTELSVGIGSSTVDQAVLDVWSKTLVIFSKDVLFFSTGPFQIPAKHLSGLSNATSSSSSSS